MLEAQRVAEMSITLLRNQGDMLPLKAERASRTLFIVLAADEDNLEGQFFIPQILQQARGAKVVRFDPRTTSADYAAALDAASNAEGIVIAPFVKRAALKGTVALPEAQVAFIKHLLESSKPVAVIAFGSPYLIRQFPTAPVYMVTYAIEEPAQLAAARALFGDIPITGHLPVRIPGIFELGTGLQIPARKAAAQANQLVK